MSPSFSAYLGANQLTTDMRSQMGQTLPVSSPSRLAEAQVVEIDGDRFVAGDPSVSVPLDQLPDYLTVFTVKDTAEPITSEWVQHALADLDSDDVFNSAFLRAVLFVSADLHQPSLTDSALQVLEGRGSVWIKTLPDTLSLSPGPHLTRNGTLAPLLKLYDDTQSAFLHAIRPGTEGWVRCRCPLC